MRMLMFVCYFKSVCMCLWLIHGILNTFSIYYAMVYFYVLHALFFDHFEKCVIPSNKVWTSGQLSQQSQQSFQGLNWFTTSKKNLSWPPSGVPKSLCTVSNHHDRVNQHKIIWGSRTEKNIWFPVKEEPYQPSLCNKTLR